MPDFDRTVLSHRVCGYYRDTQPGAQTVIRSGFTTQYDAHKLRGVLAMLGKFQDLHVQVYLQGQGWFRESDRGEQDATVFLEQ